MAILGHDSHSVRLVAIPADGHGRLEADGGRGIGGRSLPVLCDQPWSGCLKSPLPQASKGKGLCLLLFANILH